VKVKVEGLIVYSVGLLFDKVIVTELGLQVLGVLGVSQGTDVRLT
jgi:hypothetical protein